MSDLKITIEQVKNYLGTGLKVIHDEYLRDLFGVYDSGSIQQIETGNGYGPPSEFQLICYRLSDLDKFIPELGFVPVVRIGEMRSNDWSSKEKSTKALTLLIQDMKIRRIPFDMVEKLFEWHFWPFGEAYFKQGLVIDKMTYGKEASNV